jgi:adhesin/invasin
VPALPNEPFLIRYSAVQGDPNGAVLTANQVDVYRLLSTTPGATPARLSSGFISGTAQLAVRHVDASPFTYASPAPGTRLYGVALTGGFAAIGTDVGGPVPWLVSTTGVGTGSALNLREKFTTSVAIPRAASNLGGALDGQTYLVSTAAASMLDGSPVPPSIGRLFLTRDGGTTWQPFHGNGTSDLPNVPIFAVRFDPSDSTGRTIYAANEIGVYRTTDGGQTWSRFGANLPNVAVRDIFVAPDGSYVRIATYGRGLWEIVTGTTTTSTALTSSPNPSVTGHPVTLSATVNAVTPPVGTPSGTVTFLDGATTIGSAALAGNPAQATLSTTSLATGTHNLTASYAGDGTYQASTSGTVAQDVKLIPVAALPVMLNSAYGGYTTVAYVQNTSKVSAVVAIQYYDTNGNLVGVGDSTTTLAPNANWTVRQDNGHSFAPGQAGSAVISSSQPVAAFVNEFAPGGGDGSSYTAVPLPAGTGTTQYAPAIYNGAFGGYVTGINLINLGTASTDVTISYRAQDGSLVKTQSFPGVPAHAYRASYSADPGLGLPAGFAGTATLTSSGQPLAVTVNELGLGGFSSYDGVPSGSLSLQAPAALNGAYGGYTTGMNLLNTSGMAGTVTVTYFDTQGTATVRSVAIAANGYAPIYQGGTQGPAPSANGYTAVLSSTVPIVAIVNEVYNPNPALFTSYNAMAGGAAAVNLALVENAGSDGWSTGLNIMNLSSSVTTVTVTYYDAQTGTAIGTHTKSLNPNAAWGVYQGDSALGLPPGTRATAVVTAAGGGQVVVICNEVGPPSPAAPATFMSYGGQTWLPNSVTLSATPSAVPASGSATSTVTATVTDGLSGAPAPGDSVIFTISGSPAPACGSLSLGSGTTNVSGQVSGSYTVSTTVGFCIVTATESGTGSNGRAMITQTSNPPPSTVNTVVVIANPGSVPADGKATSTVTAVIKTSGGVAVAGDPLSFSTSGGSCGTISPAFATTNASGAATTTYTASTSVSSCTFRATEASSNGSGTAIIVQVAVPNSISVVASPATMPADGTSTSTITATVTSGVSGAAVAGDTVTFTTTPNPTGACGTLIADTATTNSSGQASVTYTASTTPGSCTARATDNSTGSGSTTVTQT